MTDERRAQLDDEDYLRWCGWLDRIHEEVRTLLSNRFIFRKTREIYLANPELQWDDTFLMWMHEMYAHASTATVRRLIDRHEQSISFSRLLEKMAKSPRVLSQERFISLYVKDNVPSEIGQRAFERLWGAGAQEANPSVLNRDLEELDSKAASIKAFVDIRIAHHDKKSHAVKEVPTWREFDECLDFLEQLIAKYLLALRAESHVKIVPTWQYDWTKIFTVPWIGKKG